MLTDKDTDMRMRKHCKKPLSQAGREMNFASRNVRISLMFTNQEKRGTKPMIENRNVNIITDADGKKLVLINDIRFKAKVRDDWTAVEEYLKKYIEDFTKLRELLKKYIFRQISPMNMQVQKVVLP